MVQVDQIHASLCSISASTALFNAVKDFLTPLKAFKVISTSPTEMQCESNYEMLGGWSFTYSRYSERRKLDIRVP